jgi:hypothetical protein
MASQPTDFNGIPESETPGLLKWMQELQAWEANVDAAKCCETKGQTDCRYYATYTQVPVQYKERNNNNNNNNKR